MKLLCLTLIAALFGNGAFADPGTPVAPKEVAPRALEIPSDRSLWYEQLRTSYAASDFDSAALALATIAERWPEDVSTIKDQAFATIWRQSTSSDSGSAARKRLGEALLKLNWKPSDPANNFSFLWADLALIEAGAGDRAAVRSALALATDPTELVAMRADHRFDALLPLAPSASQDIAAAWSEKLSRLNAATTADPRQLSLVILLAQDLSHLQRPAEALALIDKALARFTGPTAEAPNDPDQIVWLHNSRASALFNLGRFDEAFAEMKGALDAPENDGGNVSQVINLGGMFYEAGRPKEALQIIGLLPGRSLSTYGKLSAAEVKVCSAVQLGDAAARDAALAEMRPDAAAGFEPFTTALLCADREDEAAAFWIAALDDPIRRSQALLGLQAYRRKTTTPFLSMLAVRRAATLARTDVQTAINRYGRSLQYDFLAGPD